jgi:Ca2+-binding EF-hand superfamily protein
MSTTRRLATVIGMSLLVGSMMSSALAAAKRTAGASQSDVRQLLRMMDTDKNGAVSKDEFLQYMSQTFDRRDVNRVSVMVAPPTIFAADPG